MCLRDMISDWSDQWHELFLGDVPDARPVAVEQSVPLPPAHRTITQNHSRSGAYRIARKEEQAQFLADKCANLHASVGDLPIAYGAWPWKSTARPRILCSPSDMSWMKRKVNIGK